MNTETGTFWPRVPLKVTYSVPSGPNAGLSTWCRPVANGAPTASSALTGHAIHGHVLTPARGGGRHDQRKRDPAPRAPPAPAIPPTRATGSAGSAAGRAAPRTITRAPTTAHAGSTPTMRGVTGSGTGGWTRLDDYSSSSSTFQ